MWQTIIVIVLISLAGFYVGRRLWRTAKPKPGAAGGCGCGCSPGGQSLQTEIGRAPAGENGGPPSCCS